MFAEIKTVKPFPINLGDKSSVQGLGRGSVEMMIIVKGKRVKCRLENVVYAPTMAYNMVSVRTMSQSGKQTTFNDERCWTVKDNQVLLEGKIIDDLYCVVTDSDYTTEPVAAGLVADVNLWHLKSLRALVVGYERVWVQ